MTETTLPYQNQHLATPAKKKKTPLIIVIAVILGAVIAGILFLRQPKKTEQNKEIVPTSTTDSISPTPTIKPEIDQTSVKIQILNGTGTPGQAGIAQKALEDAGYSTDNITTDNADEYDSETTTIKAKEGFEDVADDVKSALKSDFDEIDISSSSLPEDSEYDIVVTTGGEKFEEETPTPTESEEDSTETPTETPTPTPTQEPTPTP